MDEFKKYFQDHRPDLDTDTPAEDLWEGVRKTLHPKPVFSIYKKWIAAACIVIAAGIGAFFLNGKRSQELAGQKDHNLDSLLTLATPMAAVLEGTDELGRLPVIRTRLENTSAREQAKRMTPVTEVGFRSSDNITVKKKVIKKQKPAEERDEFEGIEASYAAMLDVQLEKIRVQPIYGEKADYFDLFKKQFEELNRDEEKIKKEFRKADDKSIMLDELITVYQQKIAVLKQLQFEINKMNNKVKQTDTGIPMQQPSYIHL